MGYDLGVVGGCFIIANANLHRIGSEYAARTSSDAMASFVRPAKICCPKSRT